MDNRNKKFADMIVNYSCRVQKGERVLIEEIGTSAKPLIRELIRAVYAAGGYPYLGSERRFSQSGDYHELLQRTTGIHARI